jgi:hypothetical protein
MIGLLWPGLLCVRLDWGYCGLVCKDSGADPLGLLCPTACPAIIDVWACAAATVVPLLNDDLLGMLLGREPYLVSFGLTVVATAACVYMRVAF